MILISWQIKNFTNDLEKAELEAYGLFLPSRINSGAKRLVLIRRFRASSKNNQKMLLLQFN